MAELSMLLDSPYDGIGNVFFREAACGIVFCLIMLA